jgi:flagellar biosynthesis GTPase FlhF
LIRRFEREIDYLVHSQKEIRTLLKTPAEARPLCSFLELHDLEKDLIARLFETDEGASPDKTMTIDNLRLQLLKLCTQPQQIKIFAVGTNKVAFVGPPGCGKSALVAKVAGDLVAKRKVRTTLVNMDDYKPSAVQDINTCARVLKIPACAGEEWREPSDAQDFQVVLADTRGIPIGAAEDLNHLRQQLESFGPDEIHLVLPAYVRWREVERWLDFYRPLYPTQVALTFLDQTESFGLPFNLAAYKQLKLSYFSWGRNKLAHLEDADMYMMSNKLLEKVEEFNVHLG